MYIVGLYMYLIMLFVDDSFIGRCRYETVWYCDIAVCALHVSGNIDGIINVCVQLKYILCNVLLNHNAVMTWKRFTHYWPLERKSTSHTTWWRHQMETFPPNWPFVRGIHRSPVNSPHKGQWRRALMFSLICVWINSWVKIARLVIWYSIAPIKASL